MIGKDLKFLRRQCQNIKNENIILFEPLKFFYVGIENAEKTVNKRSASLRHLRLIKVKTPAQ